MKTTTRRIKLLAGVAFIGGTFSLFVGLSFFPGMAAKPKLTPQQQQHVADSLKKVYELKKDTLNSINESTTLLNGYINNPKSHPLNNEIAAKENTINELNRQIADLENALDKRGQWLKTYLPSKLPDMEAPLKLSIMDVQIEAIDKLIANIKPFIKDSDDARKLSEAAVSRQALWGLIKQFRTDVDSPMTPTYRRKQREEASKLCQTRLDSLEQAQFTDEILVAFDNYHDGVIVLADLIEKFNNYGKVPKLREYIATNPAALGTFKPKIIEELTKFSSENAATIKKLKQSPTPYVSRGWDAFVSQFKMNPFGNPLLYEQELQTTIEKYD
ncbi:MAG: hypothetical protein NC036_04200 [Muribaculaceae bacterium]|nr:hypothetical protein [Muribaculaceae bacterium]